MKGSGVAVSCGVDPRCGLDPALLRLWYRPEAVALAWEAPYAASVALKKQKKKKIESSCLSYMEPLKEGSP